MTGKGTGAISTIKVFGDSAETVLQKIFEPQAGKPAILKPGLIRLGTIVNSAGIIDQVTIGCEGPKTFAIHCHGNPLIVADIMKLLSVQGVKLLTAEKLLTKILSADKSLNTIAIEAKLTLADAKTLEGTKIITNQIHAGLNKKATSWLQNINQIPLQKIKDQAGAILQSSQTAKLLIAGCKIAIVGPANTGKSTLLNALAGKQKAIVTHIKGTTRDWVTATCQLGPLSIELFDTAGLDDTLTTTTKAGVDKISQKKSLQIGKDADLALLVLDNNTPASLLDRKSLEKISTKKILTVLNKSDLPAGLDVTKLPKSLSNTVQISAKLGTGIEILTQKILHVCGAAEFDLHSTVCFTSRQEKLLNQLTNAKSKKQASKTITELLNGRLRV